MESRGSACLYRTADSFGLLHTYAKIMCLILGPGDNIIYFTPAINSLRGLLLERGLSRLYSQRGP